MLLLVGLGNPGPKYEKNRHNIGFMAVDELVRRHSFGPWKARFQAQVSEGRIGSEKVLAVKPTTFMNESGRAVGEALRFFKLEPSDVVVLYDDLDLVPGKLKVKQGGGHGGHNGLRSLDAHIGQDYWRIRMGIGHPGDKARVHGHVLGDFSKQEWPTIEKVLDATARALPEFLEKGGPAFLTKAALYLKPPENQQRNKKDTPEPPKADSTPDKGAAKVAADRAGKLEGESTLAKALAKAKDKLSRSDGDQ